MVFLTCVKQDDHFKPEIRGPACIRQRSDELGKEVRH